MKVSLSVLRPSIGPFFDPEEPGTDGKLPFLWLLTSLSRTPGNAFALVEAAGLVKWSMAWRRSPFRLGLITAAIGFEPSDDVRIQAHGDGLFDGTIELADFGATPIENQGSIGKINVLVFFCGGKLRASLHPA